MKKEIGYTEAIAEVEKILARLNSDDFDVDTLSEQVKKATELIKMCKDKLRQVEKDIAEVSSDSAYGHTK